MDETQSLRDLPTQQLLDSIYNADAYGASICPIFLSSSSSSRGSSVSTTGAEDGSSASASVRRPTASSSSTTATKSGTTGSSGGGVVCTPEEQLLVGPTPAAGTGCPRNICGATDLRPVGHGATASPSMDNSSTNSKKRPRGVDWPTPSPSPLLAADITSPAVGPDGCGQLMEPQSDRKQKRVTVVSPASSSVGGTAAAGDGRPTLGDSTTAPCANHLVDSIRVSQIGASAIDDSDDDDDDGTGCRGAPSTGCADGYLGYDVHVSSIKYYLKLREAQVPVKDLAFAALTTLRAVDAYDRHTRAMMFGSR